MPPVPVKKFPVMNNIGICSGVPGSVQKIHYRGGHYMLEVAVGDTARLTLRTSTADWRIGDRVQVIKQ